MWYHTFCTVIGQVITQQKPLFMMAFWLGCQSPHGRHSTFDPRSRVYSATWGPAGICSITPSKTYEEHHKLKSDS